MCSLRLLFFRVTGGAALKLPGPQFRPPESESQLAGPRRLHFQQMPQVTLMLSSLKSTVLRQY